MSTPESSLLSAVCDYLAYRQKQCGYIFWRANNVPVYMPDQKRFRAMPKYSMKGIPDVIVIQEGQFIGLEVKPKGKYQSPDQKYFEQISKKAGAEYHVIRSVDDLVAIGL